MFTSIIFHNYLYFLYTLEFNLSQPCFILYSIFFYLDNVIPNKSKEPRRVTCQVCKETKIFEKYARHLQIHVREKLISSEELKLITFQTKLSRKDLKKQIPNIHSGNICPLCNSHVLYLDVHLLKLHISQQDIRYKHVTTAAEECCRKSHWSSNDDLIVNPIFTHNDIVPCMDLPTVVQEINPSKSAVSNNSLSTFDPPYNEDDSSNIDDLVDSPHTTSRKQLIQYTRGV